MPRQLRLHAPGCCYHVTLRGNHRQTIFRHARDRALLEDFVAESLTRYGARLHAYCWMTNHVHMLMQVGEAPLGHVMQRIASRYARTVQAQVPTTGHLFERRYHAVRVDADVYLRQLVRYVHQNPLRAGMVTQLAQYPWSSHPAYLGAVDTPSWLTTAFVLGTFGNNRSAAVAAYAQYLSEMAGDPEAAALRAADFRELGVAPFPPDPARATLRPGSTVNLDQLIGEVCAESGVDPADLRSPRRYRRLGEVRALIARRARDEGVASLSEVARRFDRDESSLRKAVERRSPSRAPPLTRP